MASESEKEKGKVGVQPTKREPTEGAEGGYIDSPPKQQEGDKGFSEGLGGAGEKELDEDVKPIKK